MTSDPILIWGAGAIGGVLGAYFARAGHAVHMVDVVADHVEAMRTTGLRIEGPVEEFTQILPASTPDALTGQFSRIYLAVKAHHTVPAMEMLIPHLAPGGYVVSAQNGLNELTIAQMIGADRTVGCFVNYGADWHGPGQILFGNRGGIAVGELDGRMTDRARAVHALLQLVEPDAALTDNIMGYLWGKMGYGALLFATALTPLSMSDAMERPQARASYIALGHEVMRLAQAMGARPISIYGFDPAAFLALDQGAMQASLDRMIANNRKTAKTHSGIWRDLAVRKRKTEVDAQIGVMVEMGAKAGVPMPVVTKLVDLIHAIEDGTCAQADDLADTLVA